MSLYSQTKEANFGLYADQSGHDLLYSLYHAEVIGLAIVGSRKAEQLALRWTHEISRIATEAGLLVLSGAAQGVDRCAHLSAIEHGGNSLAVIGCGFDHLNHQIKKLSAQGVGLASPFPNAQIPQRWTYPKRNQIIAQLATGLIVIQSAESSGSIYTARSALALKKPVWVMTHQPEHQSFRGALHLLQEGARPLLSPQSWLCELQTMKPNHIHFTGPNLKNLETKQEIDSSHLKLSSPPLLSPPNTKLWQVASDVVQSLEALAFAADITYSQALLEATQLELDGWFVAVIGVGYKRAYPTNQLI